MIVEPENRNLGGLCSTCNHVGSCAYLASAVTPVWRCEEFADCVAVSSVATARALETRPVDGPRRAPPGLCVNCDNLPTCLLPKSESGTWRCEEYR